ncbi:MAG: heavy-metal-associated domain-containing protein, partial [Actinomycetota bacterium]|nr:heavy-metal-associated domain-containing protein [Actinomycetota bacterium]
AEQHRRGHDHGRLETPEEAEHVEHAHEAPPAEHAEVGGEGAERGEQVQETVHEGVRSFALKVPMHCGNCSGRIEDRLGALDGIRRVRADHEADTVTVEHTPEVFEGQVRAKLHELGFDVVGYAEPREETRP